MIEGMKKYLLLLALGFSSVAYSHQVEPVSVRQRGLLAVVNMAAGRTKPNSIKTRMYVAEERHAVKLIQEKTREQYGKVVFLFREETNEANFLKTMQEMAADPELKTIDMILYAHGHNADPQFKEGAPAIGLYHPENTYSRSDELGPKVKAIANGKLRMLYSDACWGSTQSQDWLNAGFIAVAGAKLVDGNHAIDLKRFFKKWLYGETFQDSITFANKNLFGKVMDLIISGDSTKVPLGALDLTIDKTFIESN